MTVDEQPPTVARPEAATPDPARDAYLAAMRRPRIVYAAIIGAVCVVIIALVAVAWSGSEVAHTTLHTATNAAPQVPLQNPSSTLRPAWQSTDHAAVGTPLWNGTLITYSQHSVRGRNGTTGAILWSYTRTDRKVCQAIQDQGVTIAIFEIGGNCDEVTGLDSSTGVRDWTRTLDKDGEPVQGHPVYAVVDSTVMVTSPSVIYAFDPVSGLDRWTFAQTGCTINSAVLGSAGALISQTCTKPKCDKRKYCASGPQLLLRDGFQNHSDEGKDAANPDQIKWLRANVSAAPASADTVISAVESDPAKLEIFDGSKGFTTALLPIVNADTAAVSARTTARSELIWFGGNTYVVDSSGTKITWHAATAGAPTVTQRPNGAGSATPDLENLLLSVPSSSGIDVLKPLTGAVDRSFTVSVPPPGSLVYPFGTGFVVAGSSVAVYQ